MISVIIRLTGIVENDGSLSGSAPMELITIPLHPEDATNPDFWRPLLSGSLVLREHVPGPITLQVTMCILVVQSSAILMQLFPLSIVRCVQL